MCLFRAVSKYVIFNLVIVELVKKEAGSNTVNVVAKELDVSSLKSVRKFCNEILKEERRLDILVNNAGVAGLRKAITEDKLESQIATNHFGPFLLTNILMGTIFNFTFQS